MLCDHCHENEATIHLTQVVDQQVSKLHLCETCAEKGGYDFDSPLSITDALLGLGEPAETTHEKECVERACPACGTTRSDFKNTGRLGCAACYQTFRGDIKPLIQALHHSVKHCGQIQEAFDKDPNCHDQIAQLRARMEQAVASEAFEEAAELRDQI